MKHLEVEFKYLADNIRLNDFHTFCKSKNANLYRATYGFDHFYADPKDDSRFFRIREDDRGKELTFKKKLTEGNNFVRQELNVGVTKSTDEAVLHELLAAIGYKYNTTLNKQSFIYIYDWYVLAYYICYDANMNELGRFLEVEAREDITWESKEHAIQCITDIENEMKQIGLSASNRTKKSLFERYRK